MSDLPEKIWAWTGDTYGNEWESNEPYDGVTEYVRADILAQTLAANAALMVRDAEARGLITQFLQWWPEGARIQPPEAIAARAYLAGKDTSRSGRTG